MTNSVMKRMKKAGGMQNLLARMGGGGMPQLPPGMFPPR